MLPPERTDAAPDDRKVIEVVEIALASLDEAQRQIVQASTRLSEGERRFDAACGVLGDQVSEVDAVRTDLATQREIHHGTIAALADYRRQAETASALLLRCTESLETAARDLVARQRALDAMRRTVATRDEQLSAAVEALTDYRRGFQTVRDLVQELLSAIAGRDAAIDALSADAARQAVRLDQLTVQRDELERWSHELHQEVARLKARRR